VPTAKAPSGAGDQTDGLEAVPAAGTPQSRLVHVLLFADLSQLVELISVHHCGVLLVTDETWSLVIL
jgi:hypothetical protein